MLWGKGGKSFFEVKEVNRAAEASALESFAVALLTIVVGITLFMDEFAHFQYLVHPI